MNWLEIQKYEIPFTLSSPGTQRLSEVHLHLKWKVTWVYLYTFHLLLNKAPDINFLDFMM